MCNTNTPKLSYAQHFYAFREDLIKTNMIHYVNLAIQQFFKISFPKGRLAYRGHVGYPHDQILHG